MNNLADRLQQLFNSVDEVRRRYEEWSKDATVKGIPFDSPLFSAIETLITTFAEGDMPGPARPLDSSVKALGNYWASYKNDLAYAGGGEFDIAPGLFHALRDVTEVRHRTAPRPVMILEAPSTLQAQGVGPEQMARMYSWFKNGRPDTDRVLQVLAGPDRDKPVYQGEQIAKAMEEKQRQVAEIDATAQRKLEAMRSKPAPTGSETVASLARAGHSLEQICVIKGLPFDQVLIDLDAEGITLTQLAEFQQQARARNTGYTHQLSPTESNRLDAGMNMAGAAHEVPIVDDVYDVNSEFDDEEFVDDQPEIDPSSIAHRVTTMARFNMDAAAIAEVLQIPVEHVSAILGTAA